MLRKMFCGLALASVMTIGCGPKAEPEQKVETPEAAPAAPAEGAAPADAAPAEAAPAEEKKEG